MIVALLLAAGGLYVGYRWLRPDPPELRPVKGDLRPPLPSDEDPPPGPAATELREFLDDLSDTQVQKLRSSVPEQWWDYFAASTYATTDVMFRFVLGPVGVEFELLDDDEQSKLQRDIVWALGFQDALELKKILERAGVL